MGRICVAAAHCAGIAGRNSLENPVGLFGFVEKYTPRTENIQAATARGSPVQIRIHSGPRMGCGQFWQKHRMPSSLYHPVVTTNLCICVLGRLSESGFAGFFGFSGCGLSRGADVVGRAFASVGRAFARDVRAFTSVYGLSESGFAGFFGFSGCCLSRGADVVGRAFASVGRAFARDVRAFTSVYECLRVVWTAVRGIHVMGCDLSLAGAGVLVPLSARVVRELYELWHSGTSWTFHVGSCRVKSA